MLPSNDQLVELVGIEVLAQQRLHAATVILETLRVVVLRDLGVVDARDDVDGIRREVGTDADKGERHHQNADDENGQDA